MARPKKFDYDSDDFYDEILALAMQGLTDAEIADSLADKFGVSLSPDVFSTMKNGCYANWTEKENQRRSARFNKVLARGRRKITSIVRGAYLKGALGGKKIKSKTVLRRKLRIGGEYTEDEEIQTSETECRLLQPGCTTTIRNGERPSADRTRTLPKFRPMWTREWTLTRG